MCISSRPCLILFVIYLLIRPCSSLSDGSTLSEGGSLSVTSNRTLVSPNHHFELGFFRIGDDRWYLGIWYKKIQERVYVWVANRNEPLRGSNGSLIISKGDLVLISQSASISISTWSTKGDERSPVVAMLQDNGNFVLRYSNTKGSDYYLWESFHYPTDTLLPEMILGWTSERVHAESYLTSWKSLYDPSKGVLVLRLETTGNPRVSIKTDAGDPIFLSGPWNGLTFGRLPKLFDLRWDGQDMSFFLATNNVSYSRLVMDISGVASYLTWNESTTKWNPTWESLGDGCDIFNLCGSNSYCDPNVPSVCDCIQGFETDEQSDSNMTNQCRRSSPLECGVDTFIGLENMSYPYTVTEAVDYGFMDPERCRSMCVTECNCSAFAILNNSLQMGSSSCLVWREDLADLRRYTDGGLQLFIKVNGKKKKNIRGLVIGLSIGIPALALFAVAVFCLLKRKHNQAKAKAKAKEEAAAAAAASEVEAGYQISGPSGTLMTGQMIDFGIVQRATGYFSDSNKIGQGGFGVVYKGVLPDGQEIAVKKLVDMSSQGTAEFETEVVVIASLQHINLVRLLGWSVHQQDKVLIYEFLENGSLDSHLFVKNCELNWQTRFQIINGIAKGIKYLQEESQLKVVHRDIKAANILLDKDMVAKVSDFGLARIFQSSENEAITAKYAGTFGYMSPEYAEGGLYSTKSDIFSFGVMVLEIVSGKKNAKFSYVESDTNFLTYIWLKWEQGNWQDVVDPIIRDSSPAQSHELLRCIEIGLLCVQLLADDRPIMSHVVALLENETIETRRPKPPGFFFRRNRSDHPSSTTGESSLANDFSVMSYPSNY